MLKFKKVYSFSQWPLIDLIDHNHQMQLIKTPLPQIDLIQQLGPNYLRYQSTSLHCKYISHNQQPSEVKLLNNQNIFTQQDRLFTTYDQLQQVRESESYNKSVLKELEPEGQFTVDALQTYQPKATCDILDKNQLLLINIPINITEQEIIKFVYQQTQQNVQVQIQTCSLNLNAYAILTFNNEAEQYKQLLHLQKFNGILQECKSQLNSQDECPFNRTIIITNINKTYSLQEVLHYIGQYGRVINAVVPLEIQNVDLPLYEDIIDTLTEPCKLEILNVQTGEIDIKFFPTFEQFESLYKNYPEYYDPNLAMTVFEYQQQMNEAQDQLRLHRLLNQKTIKCLKVPEHQKEQYRKLWIPEINVEQPQQNTQYELNAKQYQNRGYCVCTFPSKAMAQRALYTINSEGTHDLAVLPLQLLNTPRFYPEHTSHSKQLKYGGKFRIENLAYTKVRAMKSWQNMELYQIDLIYNLKQLEKIRVQMSKVRDQTIDAIQKNDTDPEYRFQEKKEQIKQNVYAELNQNDEFKKFVENKTFAETLNQFQDSVSTIPNSKPGRKFDLDINSEQYQTYIQAMQNRAKTINLKQTSYVDKLVDKYQQLYVDDWVEKREKDITKSDDNLFQLLQSRLLNQYHNQEQQFDDEIEEAQQEIKEEQEDITNVQEQLENINLAFTGVKNKTEFVDEELKKKKLVELQENKDKINLGPKQIGFRRKPKTNKQEFCSLITNPVFLKKQALQRHSEFLDEIKRLLLGEEIKEEHLIAVHPLNQKDQLKLSLLFAKDNQGNQFLTEKIIEQIKQFDIPQGSAQLIKNQEDNRRALMNEITHDQIIRIKEFSKQSYTQKLIILDKHGLVTETFEVTDENADIKKMVEDLNTFVAVGTEVYDYVEDPLSKKKYIVKNEKPYVKYNLDAFDIKKEGFDSLEKQLIEILEESGFSQQETLNMLDELTKGNIPEKVLDLIDQLPDEKSDEFEEIYEKQGLTRKQYELAQSLDFRNNLKEIQDDVNQQAFIKDISKKHSPLTNDTFIKDHEEGRLRIKKNSKYLVPKLKKY